MSGGVARRADYLRRIFEAYVLRRRSALGFWHETPAVNPRAIRALPGVDPGAYYMTFREKSDYSGPFDDHGVPYLDYRGSIGLQYNPIAIAQYALGWLNRFDEPQAETKWRPSTEWLARNLVENDRGVPVWMHRFDFPYRETLRSPWYSGLAQGQGVSALLRAAALSGDDRYLHVAERAFTSLTLPIDEGGTFFTDEHGDPWLEEYVVDPPSHILNGFLWALWGVWDMAHLGRDERAVHLFDACGDTLEKNLDRFDTGYWSLYEQSPTRLPMLASPFYHRLHLVQLEVMAAITDEPVFREVLDRWRGYAARPANRYRALALKSLFKLVHY